jgi:hypothetical protein
LRRRALGCCSTGVDVFTPRRSASNPRYARSVQPIIDIRSFSINYELNAVVYDKATTGELEAAFARDMQHCREFTTEDYLARNWFLRFRDSGARLFSHLL